MNKYHLAFMLVFCTAFYGFKIYAQSETITIEGVGSVSPIIHSASGSPKNAFISFLRGDAFSATDWKIGNFEGIFKLYSTTDNFQTNGIEQARIFTNGRFNIIGGTEADVDNEGGKLILGEPDGINLALDENEIMARNGDSGADLYIQAGTTSNTILNSVGGFVFIGPPSSETSRFSINDSGFQLRLINETQLNSDWHIGASHAGWTVGGDKLVFSPTSSSSDALLILDDANDEIDARSNKITNLQNPTNDGDAVNLKTLTNSLDSHSAIMPKAISEASPTYLTFAECCKYCHDLVEESYDDWGIPNLNQVSQFIGSIVGSTWTTDIAYGVHDNDSGDPVGVSFKRIFVSLVSGLHDTVVPANSATRRSCHCVR